MTINGFWKSSKRAMWMKLDEDIENGHVYQIVIVFSHQCRTGFYQEGHQLEAMEDS